MTTGTGIDYGNLVLRVLGDQRAFDRARELWREHSPRIFDNDRERQGNKIRPSDAGRCKLQVYAELHGLYDMPENLSDIDSKMHMGIVDGARTTCLIAAGIERWCWPLSAKIEVPIDSVGDILPGHADLVVYAEPDPMEVLECKLTLWPKSIDAPDKRHKYWVYQACRYAIGLGTPTFAVAVHAPCVWNGERRKTFVYERDVWLQETMLEYGRLGEAENDEPPEPDVNYAEAEWRCRSCRFGQCERNTNPLLPAAEMTSV